MKEEFDDAIDIDEQIENLKDIGLIIGDEDFARNVLNNVSYYRLIKAYSLELKPKNDGSNRWLSRSGFVNIHHWYSHRRTLLNFLQIHKKSSLCSGLFNLFL